MFVCHFKYVSTNKILCIACPVISELIIIAEGNKTSFNRVKEGIITISGPGCSKLTTSLVNVALKFQTIIPEIRQYFLLKKCEKLLHCKSFSHFFNKKFQCLW